VKSLLFYSKPTSSTAKVMWVARDCTQTANHPEPCPSICVLRCFNMLMNRQMKVAYFATYLAETWF
jgi:hypothetical protein